MIEGAEAPIVYSDTADKISSADTFAFLARALIASMLGFVLVHIHF